MQRRHRKKQSTRTPKRKGHWLSRIVLLSSLCITLSVIGTASVVGAYYYVAPSLPPAATIGEIPLQIPLRIYSRDGRLIEEVGERRRILVTYEDLPQLVVDAFVAAEDGRFFEHPGIDYQGILRALLLLIKSGEISGGGSTITQQLARDYFLTREQLFTRKLREAFLAWQIEQTFSKKEIMALFLNKMFFGHRAYGVAAASLVYFGKSLSEINVAEAATLAGVLPAPSEYNPVRSPSNAAARRHYVLNRMHELGHINATQLEESLAYPLQSQLHGTKNELSAPYVAEMVRRAMLSRYGEDTYSAGYKVVTTLDSKLQRAANYAVRNGLLSFTRRRGYRGPIANLEQGPTTLASAFSDWPEAVRRQLQDYAAPSGLSVAIVSDVKNNSADIVFQDGGRSNIDWHGISWARAYIDGNSTGPTPKTASDVLTTGDIIYVMPITVGGWALAQLPSAQSAQVSIDPSDGAITSLVGGLDFSLSKFNRATQSARQPGSAFKPFIYSAALEAGNSLATLILDAPVVINSSVLERLWRPVNYSGRFYGEQRVREALVRSMNLASVRLLLNNTGVRRTVTHLTPFGFNDAALPRNGSLALGAGNASPLDIAQGYATFANGGYAVKPYVIDTIIGPNETIAYRADPFIVCTECESIEQKTVPTLSAEPQNLNNRPNSDNQGLAATQQPSEYGENLLNAGMPLEQMIELGENYRPDATIAPKLYEEVNVAERIITPQNAFLIQDAMRDVIARGTGIRARALRRNDLSGKTGTSNDRRDAWFAGFNANLVSVVWVGYDDDSPLGPREEGSRTALPIWIDFMGTALAGVSNNRMQIPEGIISVRISKATGCPADSTTPFQDVMFEHFREGNVPECAVDPTVPNIFNTSDGNSDLF